MKKIKILLVIFLSFFILINNNYIAFAGSAETKNNSAPSNGGNASSDVDDWYLFTSDHKSCLDWYQWWGEDYAADGSWGRITGGAELIRWYYDDYTTVDWSDGLFTS